MAAKRPYVDFQEVKEKCPLPEVIEVVLGGALFLDRFEQKGDTYQGVCPLPSHEHGPSPNPEQFKINERDGVWLWYCHGDCKKGGDVVAFVKDYFEYSDSHVRLWFADHFGDRLSTTRPQRRKKASEAKPSDELTKRAPAAREAAPPPATGTAAALAPDPPAFIMPVRQNAPPGAPPASGLKPLDFHLTLDPDVPYLNQRGVSQATILTYGIGLCRQGTLAEHVAMPLYVPEHPPPVGYLGFLPDPQQPRWKLPDGLRKEQLLFGIKPILADPAPTPVCVVEGPFQVFALDQAGVRSVALLGSSLSDYQADLLVSLNRPLVLLFTRSPRALEHLRLACQKLVQRAWLRARILPQAVDQLPPGDREQLLAFLR